MEDKIIEVFKKYSKSVDTEYNVYNCLIEEDWSNITQELVKLFYQPVVSGSLPPDEKFFELTEKICYQQFSADPMGDIVGKMNLIKKFIADEGFGTLDR